MFISKLQHIYIGDCKQIDKRLTKGTKVSRIKSVQCIEPFKHKKEKGGLYA